MHAHRNGCVIGVQALSRALPGDASVYLLLGMLRNAKGNKAEAANAYAAAVRISLVSIPPAIMIKLLSSAVRDQNVLFCHSQLAVHEQRFCTPAALCMGPLSGATAACLTLVKCQVVGLL